VPSCREGTLEKGKKREIKRRREKEKKGKKKKGPIPVGSDVIFPSNVDIVSFVLEISGSDGGQGGCVGGGEKEKGEGGFRIVREGGRGGEGGPC